MMAGVFLADAGAARSRMPTPRHHVLEPFPGSAVVAVHCMEYRDTDIGPYGEISLSIASTYGDRPTWSALRLLDAVRTGRFSAWVEELPVTTETAMWGGIDVFGYPKYLADIAFEDRAGRRVCVLRDQETAETILGKSIPRLRTSTSGRTRPKSKPSGSL